MGFPSAETAFLFEANSLLISCRNTAKWSYAYAYFIINEKNKSQKQKKELFEFIQTNLENYTQQLHEYMRKDMNAFINDFCDKKKFYEYRSAVNSLVAALKNFEQGIIDEYENDGE